METLCILSLWIQRYIKYTDNKRLRFLLVDTPETSKPGQDNEDYAQVATRFTKKANGVIYKKL